MLLISTTLITSCGERGSAQKKSADTKATILSSEPSSYQELGGLDALKKRGVIRFASFATPVGEPLPRSAIVTQSHNDLAEAFAKRLGLKAEWVDADSPDEAMQMVLRGQADIVADNFTDTETRREHIDFSKPIVQIEQQLVTSTRGPNISELANLRELNLVILEGTTYIETANRLHTEFPEIKIQLQEVPYNDDLDKLMDQVEEDPKAATILDSNEAAGLRQYRDDIRIGASVSVTENISWGMRKDSPKLRRALNNFITERVVRAEKKRISNWAEIKEKKLLRLITSNGPTYFYLWKGVLMGFDYDLAKAFAEEHDLELQVIVKPENVELIEWLKDGRGDIAGASTTITQERKDRGVAFTVPYLEMAEQIVSSKNKPTINSLEDLNGRTLTLRAFSSFIESAETLKRSGINVKVHIADPEVSYQQIVNMIASGELDATILDAHAAQIESSLRPNLQTGMVISDPKPQGWMVMPQNTELLKKLNKFITKYRKSKVYQEKMDAYFKPNGRFQQRVQARVIPGRALSPYDQLVRQSANQYEFDWRLLVAQMWQESNFNPKAVSPVGAQGLMQVMPRTAEEMGFPPPLFDPERGIKAGVKYMDWVRRHFEPTVSLDNRLWFTLASYNAGYGHLLDAQRLAKQLGYNSEVWFDNVEIAMLKLSEARYFSKARYGYVRGAEPVQYVRNIRNLYKAYTNVTTGNNDILHLLFAPPGAIPAAPYSAPYLAPNIDIPAD